MGVVFLTQQEVGYTANKVKGFGSRKGSRNGSLEPRTTFQNVVCRYVEFVAT
jgi:hypothetical protein